MPQLTPSNSRVILLALVGALGGAPQPGVHPSCPSRAQREYRRNRSRTELIESPRVWRFSKRCMNPDADLINVNGTLYGTTLTGGSDRYGTVFSITNKRPGNSIT